MHRNYGLLSEYCGHEWIRQRPGCPHVTIPLGAADGHPVGLSILALPGADAMLLALARNPAE
jgi:hypothetical protein